MLWAESNSLLVSPRPQSREKNWSSGRPSTYNSTFSEWELWMFSTPQVPTLPLALRLAMEVQYSSDLGPKTLCIFLVKSIAKNPSHFNGNKHWAQVTCHLKVLNPWNWWILIGIFSIWKSGHRCSSSTAQHCCSSFSYRADLQGQPLAPVYSFSATQTLMVEG